MKYMIVDTETNDLPNYKLPADHADQPRLAELCMILLREDKTVEEVYQAYVRPEGWEMKPGATEVNGLTTAMLRDLGKPLIEVVGVYEQAISEGYVVVAHNAQHDCKVMRGEMRRLGLPDRFEQTKNTCTMRSGMGVVVKEGGRKGWPALTDCCAHFNIPKEPKPHGARAGAEACLAVFLALDALGAMQEPAVHFAKAGTPSGEAAGLGPAVPKGKKAPKAKPAVEPEAPLAEQALPE